MKTVEPEDNIGPAWTIIALIILGFGMWLLSIHARQEGGFSWIDFGIFCVIGLLFLSIARPKKFDMVVKQLADKVPSLSYSKTGSKVKTQEHEAQGGE